MSNSDCVSGSSLSSKFHGGWTSSSLRPYKNQSTLSVLPLSLLQNLVVSLDEAIMPVQLLLQLLQLLLVW